MRGKVLLEQGAESQETITPACAGKSLALAGVLDCKKDHPRMCGEKFNCNPGSPQHWGSPPHVRGKAAVPLSPMMAYRITPACAGKRAYG